MDITETRRAYDAEVRIKPITRTGFTVEDDEEVVRLMGPFQFVSWWRLTEDAVEAAVARTVATARGTNGPLIWRVFEHDQPANLATCLERHGFVAEPSGTLMVFDLRKSLPNTPVAIEVRRAVTVQDIEDHLAVMDAVFDDDDAARLRGVYIALLDDPYFCLFTAYVDGKAIAGGRLEGGAQRQFGALFGGGVLPKHRGHGIYRALVQARALEARRLGLRYLSTEARETSRPILARLGFQAVARETTWLLRADGAAYKSPAE